MVRRLIRIYPMYALTTLGLILLAALHFYRHPESGAFPFSLDRILAALAFVPTFDGNGQVQPILGPGWTLFYEMFFYACFTAVLAFSKRHVLAPLVAIFGATLIMARLVGSKDSALAVFLGDTIMIEFLFGCAVGLLFQRGLIGPRFALPLLALGLVLFSASAPFGAPEQWRFLIWGVPAAIVLVSFLKLELAGFRWPRPLLLLGDASYSIYLVHIFFVYRFRDLLMKNVPQIAVMSGDLLILTLSVIAVIFGLAAYLLVERPLNVLLSGRYRRFGRATA